MICSTSRGLRPRPAFKALVLAALMPAALAGGCAAPQAYQQPNWIAAAPPPPPFDPETVIAKAKEQSPPAEDDGRPAQLPPRLSARALPDDPSEPWSPNYGGPAQKVKADSAWQPTAPAQDQSAAQALQQMAARRVSWQNGN